MYALPKYPSGNASVSTDAELRGDDVDTHVYDKTEKGREEIATRKYQVPPRLRALLVMIDGRRPLGALMGNVAALGLTQDNVQDLLRQDYITLVGGADPPPPPRAPAPARALSPQARMAARRAALAGAQHEANLPEPLPGTDAGPLAGEQHEAHLPEPSLGNDAGKPPAPPEDDADRFRALYDFYNQTIKSTIGLRGIVLQLKVEKCATVADLSALRLAYLEAVLKSKGRELALSLRDRLDHLVGSKPDPDPFEPG